MKDMTASDLKRLLHLEPHPREGGCFVQTFASTDTVPAEAFSPSRYDRPRPLSTAIYYLLEPDTFSEMHVLASDEVFHHYLGDPVEMLQLHPDRSSSRHILGSDVLAGERPQLTVLRGVWQGSRLLAPRIDRAAQGVRRAVQGFALLGCTVAPGFDYADYRSAARADLIARWPGEAEWIRALTRC